MTDLEMAIEMATELETLLQTRFGARGDGLGKQAASVEHLLPNCLLNNIFHLAGIRNKVVHKKGSIYAPEKFLSSWREVAHDLQKQANLLNLQSERVPRIPRPSQPEIGQEIFAGYQTITNWQTGKAIDLAKYSEENGVAVHQWEFHGEDNQQWEFRRVPGEDTAIILSKVSGKCIDVADESWEEGGVVHSWEYLGGDNQKWYIDEQEDGSFRFRVKHSEMYLEVADWSEDNGAIIQQYSWHGGGNQKWWINPVED